MKKIVIISAGKFAREIYGWLQQAIAAGQPWQVKGFLDSRREQLAGFKYPAPILAGPEEYAPQAEDLFVCAIGDPQFKRPYCEMIARKGGRFATLVHPTAVLGENVALGEGAMIAPLALLTSDITIGRLAYVGPGSVLGHDNVIGDYCQLSGHCCFGGGVRAGEGCFFGLGAVVVPNVRIDAQAFVGAGSVVLRRVRERTKVFGNPAVPIGRVSVSADVPARRAGGASRRGAPRRAKGSHGD